MQHVEELGVGIDRQLTKLDRLCSAVEFAWYEDSHYQPRINKLTLLLHLFLGTIGFVYTGSHTRRCPPPKVNMPGGVQDARRATE